MMATRPRTVNRDQGMRLAMPAAGGTAVSARTQKVALPMLDRLGPPPQFRSCIPAANYFHALSDTSTGLRSLSTVVSGAPEADLPTIGLTTMLYMGIGAGFVKDAAKQYHIAGKIGDTVGQRLALGSGLRATSLTVGATATLPLRCISFADMIGKINNPSFVPSAGVQAATSILGSIANAFFGLYYAWTAGRAAYNIYKRSDLQEELEQSQDPIGLLNQKLRVDPKELAMATEEELEDLAIDAGSDWLGKLQQEWKKAGLGDGKIGSEKERKAVVRHMFRENPDILRGTLGDKARGLAGKELLCAFGREVKRQRMAAQKEQDLGRMVGNDVLSKIKSGEIFQIKDAKAYVIGELESAKKRDWGVVAIGILGLTCTILGWVLTGGALNIIRAIGYTITSVLWIACGDFEALKRHWSEGGVGKYDKFMVYFSSLLCAAAVIGTLALSVMSGGVLPVVLLCLVGVSWMVLNGRALYRLRQFEQAPWEFEKVVRPASFHLLTQTGPEETKVRTVFKKMKEADQKALNELVVRIRHEKHYRGKIDHKQWVECIQEASLRYQEIAKSENLNSLENCRQIFLASRRAACAA
jgi:hypothetical protein